MENKKLLKYLLKDLSELDEMFAEEGKMSFDEMEMEFIKNRVSGAKRLVKMFLDKEEVKKEIGKVSTEEQIKKSSVLPPEKNVAVVQSDETGQNVKPEKKAELIDESLAKVEDQSIASVQEPVAVIPEKLEKKEEAKNNNSKIKENIVEEKIEVQKQAEKPEVNHVVSEEKLDNKEDMELDEEIETSHGKRLGDSFLKEKSVNDIMSGDLSKLEHKLSNMPLSSIKSSIGINDKFQYIRELFEGSAENFVKTVEELDAMENIKEAVDYLQTNFKWKKNDTSLKFVNLIKRRFPNE